MAANFLLNLPKKSAKRADKLDLLPFSTDTSCNAPVDKYFRSVIHTNDKNELVSTFRGRQLKGKKLKVPKSYRGVIARPVPSEDDNEARLEVTQQFSEFTYWNWDKAPSNSDRIVSALDWIEISQAIHSTGTEDEYVSQ